MSGAATVRLKPSALAAVGAVTLQQSYDNAPAIPQISVNAGQPITFDASVAGDVFQTRDEANAIQLRVGTTGSQFIGGNAAGNLLTLQGSSAANRGQVQINGSMDLDFDWTTDVGSYAMIWNTAIPASGAVIPGMMARAQAITVNAGTFITSTVDDFSVVTQAAAPGFAVNTLFFARPTYQSLTAGVAPAQSFIYAAQAQYRLTGAGAVTTTNYRALSFAPIIRVDNAGDDMRITNVNGVTVGPLYNTRNATATADFGTIRGVHMINAGTVLFGQALGSEIADNWIGVDVEALTGLVVSGERIAVRSAIPASGTSNWVIRNTGGAPSEFGAGGAHFNDNTPVQFGGTIFNSQDASIFWDGTSLDFFFAQNSDTLAINNPNNGQILLDFGANEFNLNTTAGFTIGAQTGTLGNQFGNFVTGARTQAIAGEWSDFLLTHAANLTVNQANTNVFSWTLNSTGITLSGPGTVITNAILNIGGNPGTATTNRVGVRILSNPSGGSGVNAALWLTAGRARFDGPVDINQGVALGGGAAATLGTIGGSGPTAAAQAQWVQIEIGGVNHWIAVWT